ncbi:Late embryogenesis abundant protein [Sesbania bispinosa]|nr:Late embryogenesis abundant protein [Sesbania bispinosa]
MEKQMEKETKPQSESCKGTLEGLPMEDSPYLKYKDLEDYKLQGYGTQGHQQPKPGRGAGATEAPTFSGAAVSSEAQFNAADALNRKGVP